MLHSGGNCRFGRNATANPTTNHITDTNRNTRYGKRESENTTIHHIILSSSYSTRSRIALHFPYESEIDYGTVNPVMDRIQGCFGGPIVQVGVHVIQTPSEDWESVVRKDPYFKGIRVIDSVDEFIKLIQRDQFLKGIDVAKYILTMMPCTHTRINKLTYMCYADYMCATGRRMFTDDIYAFTYGPVVDTVYRDLKEYCQEHSGKSIMYLDSDTNRMDDEQELIIPRSRLSARSRIIFAANGIDMVHSIDRSLETYGSIPTSELVAMTHREGTPWSLTDRSQNFSKISDELIREHHRKEMPSSF